MSWGPYGWYRLKQLEERPPEGWLDGADCNQIAGWTYDPDTPSQAISVDFYFDGPAGSGRGLHWTADVHRPDLCTAIGTCDHGYALPTPMGLMDGAPHAVYPYGIDSSGNGQNPLLQGAPKSFTCAPPPLPFSPAMKRHVADPNVYAAWKVNDLTDVAHLADATLDPLPQGEDIPATPSLVTPDDGSGGVFILDGALARHVQDPPSMAAWHLDWNAIVKMPKAQLAAIPQGAAWPEKPYFAKGSGPSVYLIDMALEQQAPNARARAPGGAADGSGEGAAQAGGCNFGASSPGGGAWALGMAAALFALLRRRSSSASSP